MSSSSPTGDVICSRCCCDACYKRRFNRSARKTTGESDASASHLPLGYEQRRSPILIVGQAHNLPQSGMHNGRWQLRVAREKETRCAPIQGVLGVPTAVSASAVRAGPRLRRHGWERKLRIRDMIDVGWPQCSCLQCTVDRGLESSLLATTSGARASWTSRSTWRTQPAIPRVPGRPCCGLVATTAEFAGPALRPPPARREPKRGEECPSRNTPGGRCPPDRSSSAHTAAVKAI